MPRLHRFILLLVALLAPAPAAHAQPPELSGLDAYVEQAMREWQVPGLALAVVRNDSVIYARGYGIRELGKTDAVDANTLFAIASTSKAFTAALLGMQVEADVLEWDDPVRKHLPGFELADPYVSRHVTVRDLLTHRVGVGTEDNVWIAAPFDRTEIVRRVRHLEQERGFRDAYRYNNLMYMVAGEVAAAAAGKPWDELVETRLFQPLDMQRTTSRYDVLQTRDNVASSHTRSDGKVIVMQRRNYDALGPAGSIFSSARDLAQWVRMHLNGGTYQGRRLLAEATIEEMHAPQVVIRMDSTTKRMFPTQNFAAYGLGWRMQDYHGRKIVQHTGSVNFTRTQIGMIPSENIGVIAIANLSSSTLQTALMYRIFDALLGVPATDWSGEYLALSRRSSGASNDTDPDSARAAKRPPLPLASYAGTYSDPLYGDVTIAMEGGKLVLRYSTDYVADLEHQRNDTFGARWRSTGFGSTTVTFGLDARGRVRTVEVPGFTTFRRGAGRE